MAIGAKLWLNIDDKPFIGSGRIRLLKEIENHGSINKAAKAMKMSYKAAWDSVDAMNTLSKNPLVERVSGGKGGGGTRLTDDGKILIETFEKLKLEHNRVLKSIDQKDATIDEMLEIMQKITLQTSARNQHFGEIVEADVGEIFALLKVKLSSKIAVDIKITSKSYENLQLGLNKKIFVLIKSNLLKLTTVPSDQPNLIKGAIKELIYDNHSQEAELTTECGLSFVSTAEAENLQVGKEAFAYFSTDDAIVGI